MVSQLCTYWFLSRFGIVGTAYKLILAQKCVNMIHFEMRSEEKMRKLVKLPFLWSGLKWRSIERKMGAAPTMNFSFTNH